MAALPWRLTPEGLALHLRVTPNAGRDQIEGVEQRGDGAAVLRIRVKAVPDKGRANAAVIALLAKALGVPKRAVSVVAGETARLKTVAVEGESAVLAARIAAISGAPHPS